MKSKVAEAVVTIPHSWTIETWPTEIYPATASRAKYLVRRHKKQLVAVGALSRLDGCRDLIVIGRPYVKWLEKHVYNVPDFEIAANRAPPAEVLSP